MEIAGNGRGGLRWNRPIISSAKCCESAALPPLPPVSILFPDENACSRISPAFTMSGTRSFGKTLGDVDMLLNIKRNISMGEIINHLW